MQCSRRLVHTTVHQGEVALLEVQRRASIHNTQRVAGNQPDGPLLSEPLRLHYAHVIRQCGRSHNLGEARLLHSEIEARGLSNDRFLSNLIIQMFGKCGSIPDARAAFKSIADPNVYSWTMLLAAVAQNGDYIASAQIFRSMELEGVAPDAFTFVNMLAMISGRELLLQGREIHRRILLAGMEPDVVLATSILNMYGKCGCVEEAQEVFSRIPERDLISWNAMVSVYAQNNRELEAITTLRSMLLEGIKPDSVVFISLLEACSRLRDLDQGRMMHERVIEAGFTTEDFLGHALLNMYGKCGALDDASSVFATIGSRTVVSWNVLLSSLLQNGCFPEAFKLFSEMLQDGTQPDKITFINLVDACSSAAAELERCRTLHQRVLESGIHVGAPLGNALLNLFRRAGSLVDSRLVFESLKLKDVVSWTTMLSTYTQLGFISEALKTFREMDLEGVKPDNISYIEVLEACQGPELLPEARKIQARASETEFRHDVVMNTTLVNMYGKCGSVLEAKITFDRMKLRNEVSWNAMLRVFEVNGLSDEAFRAFQQMQLEGMKPDSTTLLILLDASRDLLEGRELHSKLVENGLDSHVGVAHTLAIMYGNHGSSEEAMKVFESMSHQRSNPSLWNALIAAHSQNGEPERAAALLHQMDQEGVKLNRFTHIALLDTCSSLLQVDDLHRRLIADGFGAEQELGNALINSYGQCGDWRSAKEIFERMNHTNVISWTSSIVACASGGDSNEALKLLHEMHLEGVPPSGVTILSLIDACLGLVPVERKICSHISTISSLLEPSIVLQTSLLNMHGKCGDLENARKAFRELAFRDPVAWNAMLSAYSQNGFNSECVSLFREMDLEGVKPHRVSFLGFLDAVAGAGDLQLARGAHRRLEATGLLPDTTLENTIIGTYGRCGSVEDARRVFDALSSRDPVSWSALVVAYSQNFRAKEALELLKRMDWEGVKPGKTTYLRLLESCAMLGVLPQGRLLHRRIHEEGFESEEVLGNALIAMYGRCGSMEISRKVFESMPGNNPVTWTTMVTMYALSGSSREAAELFREMNLEGILPSAVTFLSIVTGCSHSGLVAQGVGFLLLMVEDHFIAPTAEHCNCAVDLLGRAGWLREAQEVIDHQLQQPVEGFDPMSWKVLLGACRIHGDVERGHLAASRAWDFRSDDAGSYVLLSNMFLENG